jgi:hypothetical protein
MVPGVKGDTVTMVPWLPFATRHQRWGTNYAEYYFRWVQGVCGCGNFRGLFSAVLVLPQGMSARLEHAPRSVSSLYLT